MLVWIKAQQRGSVLTGVLMVVAVLGFALLRGYELNLTQHELNVLFEQKMKCLSKV